MSGGKRFVEALRAGCRERRSIVVHEPFSSRPLASAIAVQTRDEGLDALCEVDGASPGSLTDFLRANFGPRASTVEGFAFDLGYTVILAWNIDESSPLAAELIVFAETCALRSTSSPSVVILIAEKIPTGCNSTVWDLIRSEKMLGPHDGIGFAAAMSRGAQTFEQRLKTSVAVEVGAWDLDVVERLLATSTPNATRPDLNVACWKDRRVEDWHGLQPSWEAGSFDHWGGEPYVHPLFLASNNLTLLRKRVWRGQVAILFPRLEEYRQAVVHRYRNRLRPDELSVGGDVDTLDWGPICWQLSGTGMSKQNLDALHNGRGLRNNLAHGRPVEWSDVQRFEKSMAILGLAR